MKKAKYVIIAIIIVLLIAIFTTIVRGEENIAEGTNGTCVWVIDSKGILTISPQEGNDEGTLQDVEEKNSIPWYSYAEKITEVKFEGTIYSGEICDGLFCECKNLKNIDFTNFDTSNATSMGNFLRGCSELTSIDLSNLDTSNVTNMRAMFAECEKLESIDLSKLKTKPNNVTNMQGLFYMCSGLTQVNMGEINTSYVTDMSYMFNRCSAIEKIDLSKIDTSNVTNMAYMFILCTNLKELNINIFNTSNVTNMAYMFTKCTSLKELNVKNFNTSKVTKMTSMFSGCSGLEEIDVSNFDLNKIENMSCMFYNTEINKLILGENFKFLTGATDNAILPPGMWLKEEENKEYSSSEIIKKATGVEGTYIKTKDIADGLEISEIVTYKIQIENITEWETNIEDNNENFVIKNNYIYYKLPINTEEEKYEINKELNILFKNIVTTVDEQVYNLKFTINNMVIDHLDTTNSSEQQYLKIFGNEFADGFDLSNRRLDSEIKTQIGEGENVNYDVLIQVVDNEGNIQEGTYIFSACDVDIPDKNENWESGYSEGFYLDTGFDLDKIKRADYTLINVDGNRVRGTAYDGSTEASVFLIVANASGSKFTWTAGHNCDTGIIFGYNPNFIEFKKINNKNEMISGAELAIFKEDVDNELIRWETDGNVKKVFLTTGKYILREVKTPYGYKTAEDIVFYIRADGSILIDGNKAEQVIMEDEKKTGKVIVKYVDKDTEEIEEEEIIEGEVDDSYTTTKKTIEGYEYDSVKGNTTGSITEEEIEVIYYYTKTRTYSYTVNYYDKNSYNETTGKYTKIAESKTVENKVKGTEITVESEKREISKYTYDSSDVNGNKNLTKLTIGTNEAENVINLYYIKKTGRVIVKYVDKDR